MSWWCRRLRHEDRLVGDRVGQLLPASAVVGHVAQVAPAVDEVGSRGRPRLVVLVVPLPPLDRTKGKQPVHGDVVTQQPLGRVDDMTFVPGHGPVVDEHVRSIPSHRRRHSGSDRTIRPVALRHSLREQQVELCPRQADHRHDISRPESERVEARALRHV